MPQGTVAATAHQKGKATSATKPRAVKESQKTLRCMRLVYRLREASMAAE